MARMACIFLAAALLSLPAPARAETYTLKQAVERALKANPGVEAKLLTMERAKMGVGAAQSYFWPTVSLVAGQNRLKNSGGVGTSEDFSNRSYSQGVRVSLSLFAGFAHLSNVQKSLLSVDMEKARHRQAKLELIANVQLQFLQLLKSREDMKTVHDSKRRIAEQLKAARAFVDVGMAPYLNILQNDVEMSKANQQEIRVANEIRNAEAQLNRYLGYDPRTPVGYRGDLRDFSGVVGMTEEQALRTAERHRPDLIIAQKSVDVAVKDSHITAGRYLPSVNVSYDNLHFSKDYEDDALAAANYTRDYWNVGLNVSWDVFDGGNTTFSYLGDRKQIASLRKDYEDAMAAARTEVIRALLDIQAAKELISAARKGMDAAAESYAMANKRYMTNTGTITDLLDAQLKLTQAEADYSQALTEFHGARARFFFHIGRENIGLD